MRSLKRTTSRRVHCYSSQMCHLPWFSPCTSTKTSVGSTTTAFAFALPNHMMDTVSQQNVAPCTIQFASYTWNTSTSFPYNVSRMNLLRIGQCMCGASATHYFYKGFHRKRLDFTPSKTTPRREPSLRTTSALRAHHGRFKVRVGSFSVPYPQNIHLNKKNYGHVSLMTPSLSTQQGLQPRFNVQSVVVWSRGSVPEDTIRVCKRVRAQLATSGWLSGR